MSNSSLIVASALAASLIFLGCSPQTNDGDIVIPPSSPDAAAYESVHDGPQNSGFYMPESPRLPSLYWNCVDMKQYGLPYQLLCESLAGVVNGAFMEGRSDVAVWLDIDSDSYSPSKSSIGREIGRQTAYELALNSYGPVDGIDVQVRDLFDGYVLTDVERNPESAVVASVASHVYQALIVDVTLQDRFSGLQMVYDARGKTTQDAWSEFRDKCSNNSLVVMPVGTAELRNYAISHRLFTFNLNRKQGTSSAGMNSALFDEILAWLEPNSPVLGWESGEFGEDEFVGKVSLYGHLMLAADWSYNHPLTSAGTRGRQPSALAPVINPRDIDYNEQKRFVSFFLSDGDNYQWVMGDGFVKDFYVMPERLETKMSFGLPAQALSELAPDRYTRLFGLCGEDNTLIETFGGGYFYADTYALKTGHRESGLAQIAARTSTHMRSHRLKVLQLISWRAFSQDAMEAYQAFVDANDQLEGIVVIQYSPYTGGRGEIRWCTNKKGYDIPVISVKYTLWKGLSTDDGGGNPQQVSESMNSREPSGRSSFSLCCVHAWSAFDGRRSASAAQACLEQLPGDFKAVSTQELIWRVRMAYRPEQTRQYLSTIK